MQLVNAKKTDRGGLPCKLSDFNIKRLWVDDYYLQPSCRELFWEIQVVIYEKQNFDCTLRLMLYTTEKNLARGVSESFTKLR